MDYAHETDGYTKGVGSMLMKRHSRFKNADLNALDNAARTRIENYQKLEKELLDKLDQAVWAVQMFDNSC